MGANSNDYVKTGNALENDNLAERETSLVRLNAEYVPNFTVYGSRNH